MSVAQARANCMRASAHASACTSKSTLYATGSCACACIAVRELRAQPVIEAGLPGHLRGDSGPSCCAAFALGSTSSTACPASYGKLVTAVACEAAAGAVGLKYGGSGAFSSSPYGCYWHTITGSVYYNSNGAGAANAFAQPLCTGAARSSAVAGVRAAASTLALSLFVRVRACVRPARRTHRGSYACARTCARMLFFWLGCFGRLLISAVWL
jgi:hypothetical protein